MESLLDVSQIIDTDSNPTLVWEAIAAKAVENHVSDVHLTAQRDEYRLSFRMDGDLLEQGTMPHEFCRRLISHVKMLATIDLGENRRPTEGRMLMDIDDKRIEMRVSTIPTLHGQDMVVRIFDHTVSLLSLSELGLLREQYEAMRDLCSRPNGLILVSGPSGSGKTTTLYALLRHIAGRTRKIVTIENPVEFDLHGVNQTEVNPKIGVGFAVLLRALLRQDPDVIMVGEIRDEETAVTAVRAANTGHLVLATTHANRASRAVETMLSLGVHPYFLATALRATLAQVLVKRICPECKEALPATADLLISDGVRRRLGDVEPKLYQGAGCETCRHTGYRGRMGLFELFVPDDSARALILERRPATDFDTAARESDHLDLEQVGRLAAFSGQTTIEEVVSVMPTF
jgi:type II secretory ATPase GspE/PulE/Tfp pilus assembly ATPase PilB-like protein